MLETYRVINSRRCIDAETECSIRAFFDTDDVDGVPGKDQRSGTHIKPRVVR